MLIQKRIKAIEKIGSKSQNQNMHLKTIKQINWGLFCMIILLVMYMFNLKSDVQDLTYEHRQITNQITTENIQYNLLKAELAYLNSPKRLKILASQYLGLKDINPSRISMEIFDRIENSYNETETLRQAKSNKKWRYKNIDPIIQNTTLKLRSR
ncbi:MAG: hypothetical protein SFT93_02225 [Rickettsiaceae bacterium]|nr:hypothetical protein [Rickettsiaceae bacterium]